MLAFPVIATTLPFAIVDTIETDDLPAVGVGALDVYYIFMTTRDLDACTIGAVNINNWNDRETREKL